MLALLLAAVLGTPAADAATNPIMAEAPSISGSAQDGQTLVGAPGRWTGTRPIAYAYQWRRCNDAGVACGDIRGAASDTYRLSSSDVGTRIELEVVATNPGGSTAATSEPTDAVEPVPPVNTGSRRPSSPPHLRRSVRAGGLPRPLRPGGM